MSRRITLSILAACTALSATPAFADNDCFDQTTCPPAEETLAREQRALEERTKELRAQEAQAAAEALAKQRAEEHRAQELAAQEAAAREQAAQTQRAMERAAQEQAQREEAAAARAAQDDAVHEQQYAKERQAEEQRAAERRAQQQRAEEQARMPNVMEPVVQAPVIQVPEAVEASQTAQAPKETKEPASAAPRTKQPAILSTVTGIVPPISAVPPKKIARPAERYEEPARPQKPSKRVVEAPRSQPASMVQLAPSTYEEPREPVRAAYPAPMITGSVPVQSPVVSAPVYVVNQGGGSTVVVVKGSTYEDGVTPVAANIRPDPAMKVCQTDRRSDGRYVYCNQASYHPYGANGYRPMGTYQAYRTAPAYIAVAPSPRIISLQVGD